MNMYYCGKPGCPGHNSFSAVCKQRDYSNYRHPALMSFVLDTFEDGDPDDESSPINQPRNWRIEGEDYPKPLNGSGHTNGNGNGNGHSANGNGNGHANDNENHNGSNGNGNGHSHPPTGLPPTKMKANLQYKLKNLRDKKQGK